MIDARHHFCDGMCVKEMQLAAGFCAVTHRHVYDHFSILGKGRARVTVGEETAVHVAPALILIRKGHDHCIEALEDLNWYCIHATTCTDPLMIDRVLIEGN